MEDSHFAYRNQYKDGTFEVKCDVLGTAQIGWLTPADDSLLPTRVTWPFCHAIDVCGRVSRLKDPGGNHRHDEARQYAIRDDRAGKIRLLAREMLTYAIAAQLSGVDCRGNFVASLTISWKAIGKLTALFAIPCPTAANPSHPWSIH